MIEHPRYTPRNPNVEPCHCGAAVGEKCVAYKSKKPMKSYTHQVLRPVKFQRREE